MTWSEARKERAMLVLCLVVLLIASLILSRPSSRPWFDKLDAPSFDPPTWLFGALWTIPFLLAGIAVWMIWKKEGISLRIHIFIAQLSLAILWSYFFFGLLCPGLALLDLAVVWIIAMLTLVLFWRGRREAVILLIPYLIWLLIGTAVNISLFQANV